MDEHKKQQLKDSIRLSEWIGRDIQLKPAGDGEWSALCPFHNEKSPSFTVSDHKQIFHCFGCNESGDLFDWVMQRRNVPFPEALAEVARTVGMVIEDDRQFAPAPKTSPAPKREKLDTSKFAPLDPAGQVARYLTDTRKIPADILTRYNLGQTADGEAVVFACKALHPKSGKPYTEFCKMLKVERPDGKKVEWRHPKGGRSILFGMLSVPEDADVLVIAEGEMDALSWAAYGVAAVSVPSGAKALQWVENCWEWLSEKRWRRIAISFDEDTAGRTAIEEVVKRLGMHRTDIIRLPEQSPGERYKDANACLQAGVTRDAMLEALAAPEIIKPHKLKSASELGDEIWSKFHPQGIDQLGHPLPWGNRHGSSLPFRIRRGEVTVWSGYNKHGKSEVLNHVVVDLAWRDERVMIASLEVQAAQTYHKLLRMITCRRTAYGVDERHRFDTEALPLLEGRFYVYDHVGHAPLHDVLDAMLYARQRYGVRQFVIDSFMRISGLEGDGQVVWQKQQDVMNAILVFAEEYDCHVHLVAHSKKPDRGGEARIPRRYDIMGSSYIPNLAFNVVVVWRNRAKHDALEEVWQECRDRWEDLHPNQKPPPFKRLMGRMPDPSRGDLMEQYTAAIDIVQNQISDENRTKFLENVKLHDAYFIVDAQRGGDGDTPAAQLWFDADSLQFIERCPMQTEPGNPKPGTTPRPYYQEVQEIAL